MVAGETAHGWRWLGHTVGAWRGPAVLTSLRCCLSVWILPSLCSGPCLRPCFAPQPVLHSDSSPRRNGCLLTAHKPLKQASPQNRVAGLGGEDRGWRSWEITFVQGLRHLPAEVLPLLQKCNAHKQLLTAHLSHLLWLRIQSLFQSFIYKSISGHVACFSLLPFALLSIRRVGSGQIHAGE